MTNHRKGFIFQEGGILMFYFNLSVGHTCVLPFLNVYLFYKFSWMYGTFHHKTIKSITAGAQALFPQVIIFNSYEIFYLVGITLFYLNIPI